MQNQEDQLATNESELSILKLVTGEMIIGDVLQNEDGSYTVTLPTSMTLNPESGSIGLMPFDFIYVMDYISKINLKAEHVVIIHKNIPPEIMEAYANFLDDTNKEIEAIWEIEDQLRKEAAEIEAQETQEAKED